MKYPIIQMQYLEGNENEENAHRSWKQRWAGLRLLESGKYSYSLGGP